MDLSTLDTSSCSRIPDVLCSDEGDVLELHLASRALEGTIPSSFASLTALRKVDLNKNKCVGKTPPAVAADPKARTRASAGVPHAACGCFRRLTWMHDRLLRKARGAVWVQAARDHTRLSV